MKRLRVNDYDMAYIEVGQGRPLVCVHGSIGDFRTWSSVLGPLSRAHRVIAVSLRHFFPEQWNGIDGRYTMRSMFPTWSPSWMLSMPDRST
jgi:pimeloyl-ACP methyl ester carboxylesterase